MVLQRAWMYSSRPTTKEINGEVENPVNASLTGVPRSIPGWVPRGLFKKPLTLFPPLLFWQGPFLSATQHLLLLEAMEFPEELANPDVVGALVQVRPVRAEIQTFIQSWLWRKRNILPDTTNQQRLFLAERARAYFTQTSFMANLDVRPHA